MHRRRWPPSQTNNPPSPSSLRCGIRELLTISGLSRSQVGDHYRSNDDGEPSGTAGKPIHSAIVSSGIDRVMVVVIRYFGGIKLGTGGLVRAYGGVASECLRNAPTCLVKSEVRTGVEVPYDLLGTLYHQLQSFQVEDIKQDYETGKDGTTMVTFKADFDCVEKLEDAIKDRRNDVCMSLDQKDKENTRLRELMAINDPHSAFVS